MEIDDLQRLVSAAARRVFAALGRGFTESIYRDALCAELGQTCPHLVSDPEPVLPVTYTNRHVGFVRPDVFLLVRRPAADPPVLSMVVELKALATPLSEAHMAQLLAYLRVLPGRSVTRGLLINFDQRDLWMRRALQNDAYDVDVGDGGGQRGDATEVAAEPLCIRHWTVSWSTLARQVAVPQIVAVTLSDCDPPPVESPFEISSSAPLLAAAPVVAAPVSVGCAVVPLAAAAATDHAPWLCRRRPASSETTDVVIPSAPLPPLPTRCPEPAKADDSDNHDVDISPPTPSHFIAERRKRFKAAAAARISSAAQKLGVENGPSLHSLLYSAPTIPAAVSAVTTMADADTSASTPAPPGLPS